MRACAEHGAAIVPQGGNTGLVGGAVPAGGRGACCSLRRLDRVARGRRRRRAGDRRRRRDRRPRCTAAARAAGLGRTASTSPPATRATVGGTVATNAGGLRVLRYGDMRAQVARRRGGAGRRLGRPPPRRAGEGQHRLRPRRRCCAAARGRSASSPRRGCGWCRAPTSGWSPCWPCRRCRRRGRRGAAAAPAPARRSTRPSCSSRDGARPGLRGARAARPFVGDARGVPAGRVRPAPPTRPTTWPLPSTALDGVADAAVAADGAAAGRAVALPRGAHRGDQHASARRTSST